MSKYDTMITFQQHKKVLVKSTDIQETTINFITIQTARGGSEDHKRQLLKNLLDQRATLSRDQLANLQN